MQIVQRTHTAASISQGLRKAPISERALVARINRKLDHSDEALKKCRVNSRWYSTLGDYYLVNNQSNTIVAYHVDIEDLARNCGVLNEWEVLELDVE